MKKSKIEATLDEEKKYGKRFYRGFLIWICILAFGLVRMELQNDTFYTIKIGELILNNGIDMLDHFSFHAGLAYTYPHWLYDVFIYFIYSLFGLKGIYISSIILLMILLGAVFKTNNLVCESKMISAFATFICALAISGFVTARAQLVSFILFIIEIYFIEAFLKKKHWKYLAGLFLISLALCNIHVAVWPFYFILYLPYLAEYLLSFIFSKFKNKKNGKIITFLDRKFEFEKNENVKYLLLIMGISVLTGLMTPIGDTPYTYLIKTMMGNSQKYIQEHQMISWINSPFTIIIAGETIFLTCLAKVKLRDLFMICGLVIMSIFSVRHISLLALIGTVCFARVFATFLSNYGFAVDKMLLKFFNKKIVVISSFMLVIVGTLLLFNTQMKDDFINKELYPVEATKYIKENIDVSKMKLFNDYNFGSYLLFNDIPVFIDSRADLYTKQFSGLEYDIFDDYESIIINYQEKFEFYGITHALIYKNNNNFYQVLDRDLNYKIIYEDDNFGLFEKIGSSDVVISYIN